MSVRQPQMPKYRASRRISSPGNADAVRQRFGRQANSSILESIAADGVSGRWSYYAMRPCDTIRSNDSGSAALGDLATKLRAGISRFPDQRFDDASPPFCGGWIGAMSYEAGRWIEPTAGWNHAATPFGFCEWRFYDTILAHDATMDTWHVAGIEHADPSIAAPLSDRLAELEAFVDDNASAISLSEPSVASAAVGNWNLSVDEYLQRVERILAYIRSGDVYQVNLTRRFTAELRRSAQDLYDSLCRQNPAAYAAFLRFDDDGPMRTIQSSSPELFLSLDDGVVSTRPIKGTRPRTHDARRDALAVADLEASDKERAELNMIIDLERNDLGRVCEYGSIRVENPGEIESFPTVFHRTATIRGRLREECDAIDLIRATFPGGSITGAPKVRAMQIIDELEPDARGPYCGAIGYIGVDGNMMLNLPIRTLTTVDQAVTLAVGSGIVADSDPRSELEELTAKAAGMMTAIAQCQQTRSHVSDDAAKGGIASGATGCVDASEPGNRSRTPHHHGACAGAKL